jgi:hypothetical protein
MISGTIVSTSATVSVAELTGQPRHWRSQQAAANGADWPGVISNALDLMAIAGILEAPPGKAPWDGPSWRAAAAAYHENRPTVTIGAHRLAHLRHLMAPEIGLDHAWHQLRDQHFNKRRF